MMDHYDKRSAHGQTSKANLLTDFPRVAGLVGIYTVRSIPTTCAAKGVPCARSAWIELHGQILTHGLGDGITALAGFDAFLCEHLDLRPSG